MSYIEKEKLIKADIASIENKVRHAFNQGYDLGYKEGKSKQEPKTGHWVGIDEYPHEDYECDNCGFIHTFIDGHTAQYNYCPNCGCRMVEPQESEG
jgi:ribulose bisphosphate carboxylase small subunit